MRNYILTGATYHLISDKNAKFYGGILKINIKNEEQLLKQLKQLFYFSLGQFTFDYSTENNSLLSKTYDNSNSISNYDLSLLKFHYHIIYDQKINGTTFKKLLEIAKKHN